MPNFPDWEPVSCTSSRQNATWPVANPCGFFQDMIVGETFLGVTMMSHRKVSNNSFIDATVMSEGAGLEVLHERIKSIYIYIIYTSYLGPTPHPVTVTTWITFLVKDPDKPLFFATGEWVGPSYHAVWGNEKFMSKSTSESKTLGPADLNNSQGASLRFKVRNISMPLTSELSNPTNERFDALCT